MSYAEFVEARRKSGANILKAKTADMADWDHIGHLITGEAGETVDVIKKHTVYGQPLDEAHLIEELGDILFGVQSAANKLGITMADLITENMAKLSRRYPDKYSDAAAKARADKQ